MDAKKRKAIASRLEKLAALNRGRLTPEKVVNEAKDPKSPLHSEFTWDDTAAAHQYRLAQARDLIRGVKVEVHTEQRVVSTVRYMRDPEAQRDEQGYVEVAKLRTDKDLAREALDREVTQAEARMERAAAIAVQLGLEAEFAEVLERIRGLKVPLQLAA